jgi:hypothetical protein
MLGRMEKTECTNCGEAFDIPDHVKEVRRIDRRADERDSVQTIVLARHSTVTWHRQFCAAVRGVIGSNQLKGWDCRP